MKKILLISLCLCTATDLYPQAALQTSPLADSSLTNRPVAARRRGPVSPKTTQARKQRSAVLKDFTTSPAPSRIAGGTGSFVAAVSERGPHHKVMQSVIAQTNLNGQIFYRTNAYTELATGMHYQENGEWKETQELIEPFEGGAVARFGPVLTTSS